ncbi:MAG: hypothetical protein GY949_04960 [Gammaproteobacteria bacterium]|nr:hypothetical protein [Gammaproteobacteria bacterium]
MSSTADDIEYPSTFAPLTEAREVPEVASFFARLLAHEIPHAVRQVIYLGKPFNISDDQSVDLPIRRIYERINPTEIPSELMQSTVGIRVSGSHTGLPFNLPVLFAVADRLSQPAEEWEPFSFDGVRKCLYSPAAV